MTPLENAISDLLSARITGKQINVREILSTAHLGGGHFGMLIELLGRWDQAGFLNILTALRDHPIRGRRDLIAHDLLIWIMYNMLPKILDGEGIGRAAKSCRFAVKHLEADDLDYGKWEEVRDGLNSVLIHVKDQVSRSVVDQFRAVVAEKASRRQPAIRLQSVLMSMVYSINRREEIPQVTAKLCALIREEADG